MSLRLTDKELNWIKEIAAKEKKGKSMVARELLSYGRKFLLIKGYREGKLSLGNVAKGLGLSISETIDFLSEFGIESPIMYDDYLKGVEILKGL